MEEQMLFANVQCTTFSEKIFRCILICKTVSLSKVLFQITYCFTIVEKITANDVGLIPKNSLDYLNRFYGFSFQISMIQFRNLSQIDKLEFDFWLKSQLILLPSMNMNQEQVTRQNLERKIKTLFDDIKKNYFEFLESLKFQNFEDRRRFKENARKNKLNRNLDEDDEEQENHIEEMKKKNFEFQAEMALQNHGRIAGLKLIQNIKQLNDLNSSIMLYDLENTDQKNKNSTEEFIQKLKYFEHSMTAIFNDISR